MYFCFVPIAKILVRRANAVPQSAIYRKVSQTSSELSCTLYARGTYNSASSGFTHLPHFPSSGVSWHENRSLGKPLDHTVPAYARSRRAIMYKEVIFVKIVRQLISPSFRSCLHPTPGGSHITHFLPAGLRSFKKQPHASFL
jgi:hypothetical protein